MYQLPELLLKSLTHSLHERYFSDLNFQILLETEHSNYEMLATVCSTNSFKPLYRVLIPFFLFCHRSIEGYSFLACFHVWLVSVLKM